MTDNDTGRSSASATVTEEDVLRRYNSHWRDTAYGRAEHYRRCPQSSHRRCDGAR